MSGREMLPAVVRSWPATRSVFDRYGLQGCGGPYGPAESIAYFARAHGVDLEKLLRELEEAVVRGVAPSGDGGPGAPDPAGTIYRRFFLGGIVATLTAGAAWGAYLLLHLGFSGSFSAVSVHDVNAHGHAQIFGWVGLFVMGFAYQAFPRFKHGALKRPRLALATFPLFVAGLVTRTVSEALAPSTLLLYSGLTGAVIEITAILIFAAIVAETLLARTARPLASDRYILSATFWFVAQAAYDAFLYWMTSTAGSTEELVRRVATFQVPLRDMQIHGFATLMILGVSQRYLPGMIGLRQVPEKLADTLLAVLNLAVAGEVAGFLGRRLAPSPVFSGLLEASVLAFAAAAGVLVWKFGILHRPAESDRSVKFLRAAYAWLVASLIMLLLLPAYLALTGQAFSHAYFGATRHAVTVGFISLMIVGVASKVVPTLNGVPASALPRLWAPFLLLNTGCLLRVLFQTLTDFTGAAFPVAGVSGLLEVAGLAVWGVHIALVIAGRYRFAIDAASASGAPAEARPEHIVGWLTAVAPETIGVFEKMGFTAITNRLLRETVARTVTIHQACALKGIDEAELIMRLNEVLGRRLEIARRDVTPIEFVGRLAKT